MKHYGTIVGKFSGTRKHWVPSSHAQERMTEREISLEDLDYIIQNGIFSRQPHNRMMYTLPDSPFACLAADPQREKLNGTSVILADDGTVVTVFWNDDRCPVEYREVLYV